MTTASKYRIKISVRELRRPVDAADAPFSMDLKDERWADNPLEALNRAYAAARICASSDEGTESIIQELTKQGIVFPGGERRPPRGYFVFEAPLLDPEVPSFFFSTPLDNDLGEFVHRVREGEDPEPDFESYEQACAAAWAHADELWLGAPPDLPAIPKYAQLPVGHHPIASFETDEELTEHIVWHCASPDGTFGEYREFWDGERLHKTILATIRRRQDDGGEA